MTKTIKVTYTGGFHSHNVVTLRARKELLRTGDLVAVLTKTQAARLQRTFCGIKGCICGGSYRATAEAPQGWTVVSEGVLNGGVVALLD